MSWLRLEHSGKYCEFVSILAGSWHSDGPGVVKIHVAHFVSDELELVSI